VKKFLPHIILLKIKKKTIFASVRFGNVLGSSGSFIPLFYNQIQSNKPLTLTDKKMTRFIMTIDNAVDLMIKSSVIARGGEVFVFKMDTVRIIDVAEVMIEIFSGKNKKIKIIGSRPGEKLYEELISDEELRRLSEQDKYFVIYPAFLINKKNKSYINKKLDINSLNAKYISKTKIKSILKKNLKFFNKHNIVNTAFSPFVKK